MILPYLIIRLSNSRIILSECASVKNKVNFWNFVHLYEDLSQSPGPAQLVPWLAAARASQRALEPSLKQKARASVGTQVFGEGTPGQLWA